MTTEPVGLSKNLPEGRVMRAQIGDVDLAIWRSVSGRLSAWTNRCPHRGMRLSHGFVRGEALACLYHGWHYNAEGKCRYIPAHPDLEPPETIQVQSYSVAEQGGVLWVADEGEADPPSIDGNFEPVRSISFACELARLIEAMAEIPLSGTDGTTLVANTAQTDAIALESGSGESAVRLFVQRSAGRIVAHVLASDDWTTDGRLEISRWCEAVRRVAETRQTAQAANGQDMDQ